MVDGMSARLALPLLQPGQAQKELYHNEALALLDIAAQAVVEAVGLGTPPIAPTPGACWVVGVGSGEWEGQSGTIAGWTSGGWRFVPPRRGFAVWSIADSAIARFDGAAWRTEPGPGVAIPDPTGGATVDTQAREAIAAILAELRRHALTL